MKISNFSKISTNIFGSRVTGFIRDILFANYLGANLMSDAFLFAFRLPNLFRRIFAEGSMNSVFIPLYVNQEKINSKMAKDFIWIIFNFFFVITLFISLLIFFFSEQVISLLDYGLENLIFPSQPSLSKSDNAEDVPFYFNESYYNYNDFHVKELINVNFLGLSLRSLFESNPSFGPISKILKPEVFFISFNSSKSNSL